MRILDKANVSRGFSTATGFDIHGMKGYDGYTGYTWCNRYPFNRVEYEHFLTTEEEERLRKSRESENADPEPKAARIKRYSQDKSEHFKKAIDSGVFGHQRGMRRCKE